MIPDLSKIEYFDASKYDSAIVCYRRPEPLYIEINGPVFNIFNIREGKIDRSTKPITLPVMTLDKFFKKWPGLKQIAGDKGVYYREPGPCHAVSLDVGQYSVSARLGGSNWEVTSGDYIITKESGLNEICKKDDFKERFILSMSQLRDPFNAISLTTNNDHCVG